MTERLQRVAVPEQLTGVEPDGLILSLKPGDKLVLMCDRILPEHEIARIKELAPRLFGTDQIVVLGPGMSIGVLRQEQPTQPAEKDWSAVGRPAGGPVTPSPWMNPPSLPNQGDAP